MFCDVSSSCAISAIKTDELIIRSDRVSISVHDRLVFAMSIVRETGSGVNSTDTFSVPRMGD